MKLIDVLVPATGNEGELEVIEISVAQGDKLAVDDTVVVLESDKATVEVPSPLAGTVATLNIKVGDKVKEGNLLLKVEAAERSNSTEDKNNSTSDAKAEDQTEQPNAASEPEKKPTSSVETKTVIVPDLGGSDSVDVIEVVVNVGDKITVDETLVVLESDKATMEIPSTASGTIQSIALKVGDKVSQGDVIAKIISENEMVMREQNESTTPATNQQQTIDKANSKLGDNTSTNTSNAVQSQQDISSSAIVHAGPAVRKFAREHGVDLGKVNATGPKSRVLVEDVSAYIKAQVQLAQSGGVQSGALGLQALPLPDFSQFGEISVSSMTKVHQKTAENMQRSWSVPQVTQFDEADITDLETFRAAQKMQAESRGVKLTPIAFLLKACAYVIKALPQFNVALDLKNQQLIQKHYVHIGVAVDTEHGLFVPVVRNVDQKGIWELAEECQHLAKLAREKKLKPSEMQGGCFTISSLGAIGGTAFTPIVNTPEVAILGVSKAQMKPVYQLNKQFEPRLMLPLSLSYDHRAVNGADAARFTSLLAKLLGDIRELLL